MNVFDILVNYKDGLSKGLFETFKLCLIIWVSGLTIGSLLGVAGSRWKKLIGIPQMTTSFLLSGIPVLVFLFWMHYPMQAILNVVIDPFVTAALTLSVINIFAVSDLVRRILNEFPEQYIVAAKVCGMSTKETLLKIQMPIVLRQALPGLLLLQVNMLQATLFASLISVDEIFRVAQRINSIVYKPVEIYTALGILFLSICLPLNGLAFWLKQKYTRDFSEA